MGSCVDPTEKYGCVEPDAVVRSAEDAMDKGQVL